MEEIMNLQISLVGTLLFLTTMLPAQAYSVCGLSKSQASFRTKNHLITICSGEASFQMIMTYIDGTGYEKIPVERSQNKYQGSWEDTDYKIDSKFLVIKSKREAPITEKVLEHH
jgi:hypothetical protein